MATSTVDLSGIDTGADETVDQVDQSQEQQVEQVDQQQATDGQQSTQVDGRRGPANVRNSVKAVAEWAQNNAAEALPEHAAGIKALGDAYFRAEAYKQHFPTPQEAASAKQLIDGIGGVEGATQLQTRMAQYDAQDVGLKDGNPEVLDAFFKDFPDGAAALAPHYLDKLAEANPQAFTAAIAPHAMALLENAGIGSFVEQMANETDPAKLTAQAKQLQQWIQQQSQNVKQQPKAKDPREDRIAAREQELNQQAETAFTTSVQTHVNGVVNTAVANTVAQYAKQNRWNDDQKAEFQEKLIADIVKQMGADKTYEQQVNIRKERKDRTPEGIGKYISDEFVRRMNDKDGAMATAARVKKLFGQGAAQQTTGVVKADAPKTAPTGGPLYVSQKPQNSEFADYPDLQMDIIQGRAKLKNGRFVTWRK